jgi:hypothetical protein
MTILPLNSKLNHLTPTKFKLLSILSLCLLTLTIPVQVFASVYSNPSNDNIKISSGQYQTINILERYKQNDEEQKIAVLTISDEEINKNLISNRNAVIDKANNTVNSNKTALAKKLLEQKKKAEEEAKKNKVTPVPPSSTPVDEGNLDPNPSELKSMIIAACAEFGCDARFLFDTMWCESTGKNHRDTYHKGYFQFLPSTFAANAARIGIKNPNITIPMQQTRVSAYMFSKGQSGQWPTCSAKSRNGTVTNSPWNRL